MDKVIDCSIGKPITPITSIKTIENQMKWGIEMETYLFYLEFDGRPHNLDEALAERIQAGSLQQAVKKFYKQKNLNFEGIDNLDNEQFRIFLYKRGRWFRSSKQSFIYFVCLEK